MKRAMKLVAVAMATAIAAAFSLFAGAAVFAAAPYPDENYDGVHDAMVAEFGEDFVANHLEAVLVSQSFHNALPERRDGTLVFPDIYGGMYIDEYGNLNVLVVGSLLARASMDFLDEFGLCGVNVREVRFSYNELREVFDALGYIMQHYPETTRNVHGVGFCVISNHVIVYLEEYGSLQIDGFEANVMASPMIVFEQSPGPIVIDLPNYGDSLGFGFGFDSETELLGEPPEVDRWEDFGPDSIPGPGVPVTLRPGDAVWIRNSGGGLTWGGSIGYRVTFVENGAPQVGYTTAAHLTLTGLGRPLQNGDRLYNSNGVHIGVVSLATLPGIDVAFFRRTPNAEATNLTGMGLVRPTIIHTITGMTVVMDGMVTGRAVFGVVGQEHQGNIGSAPHSFFVSGFRATYRSALGDSGGIVYHWTSASNNGVVGINVGGWFNLDPVVSLFTTVTDHRRSFGNVINLH